MLGQAPRDCVSCFHSRLEVPRQPEPPMSTAPGKPPSPFAEGGGDVPASIQKAAEDGQVGAVLSWFDGGGRVDETFEYAFG